MKLLNIVSGAGTRCKSVIAQLTFVAMSSKGFFFNPIPAYIKYNCIDLRTLSMSTISRMRKLMHLHFFCNYTMKVNTMNFTSMSSRKISEEHKTRMTLNYDIRT